MFDILLISIAVAMDSFSVSICAGASLKKPGYKKPMLVALYFGFFQAFMTFLGFEGSKFIEGTISKFDHWIAFGLLVFIGGNMIRSFFDKEDECGFSFKHANLFVLAIATSIDAVGVGISMSIVNQSLMALVLSIGIVTFLFSFLGVRIGRFLSKYIKNYGELLGGILLILIGLKILFEHNVF